MSTTILRPLGVLGAVEAMDLRNNFQRVVDNRDSGVVVDLTGVQLLSAAGLAAVTNILGQGRRSGIQVRVLPPEEGSEAALVIEQADLRRFLAPGGLWNALANEQRDEIAKRGSADPRRGWSFAARVGRQFRRALGAKSDRAAETAVGCR
ncbi:MAG: STAS domain-containing protein [Verrucomicrobiae bacterium]|nr:STAS domain-containing protein [Verrucomicrobiae bacterium]